MQILELESKTGLDRATIRHYEKEGLVQPTRRENGYRDYSDENVNDLLKIKLLRQLGMSLDKIRKLQQGSDGFSNALAEQIRILQQQMDMAQRAKDVCSQMLKDGVTYKTMDAQTYIDQLTQQRSLTFPKQFHEPIVVRPYHPVRRYVARIFDYSLIKTLILVLIFVVFRIRPGTKLLTNVISYGAPVLAIPILAFLMARLGTTPGKWLMGLEVRSIYGGNMHYEAALSREAQVFTRGYGLGIPLISPIREFISYRNYGHGDPEWDEYCEYIYHPWTNKRKIAFILSIILIISALFATSLDLIKPKYRGDLTISEFSSNYNDYLYTIGDVSSDAYLKTDGTWEDPVENHGQGVIVVGAETETDPLRFQLEGEYVTGFQFHKRWTGLVFPVTPLDAVTQVLSLTMVMSQKEAGYRDATELLMQIDEHASEKSATFICGNYEISWRIETVNCKQVGNFGYAAENDELDASMELFFEIHKR